MKILIIEDDKSLRQIVKTVLEKNGYMVTAVENGADGLAQALANTFDCIILDMNLPDADGLDILKTIRSSSVGTPLVITSARDSVDIKVKGLYTGADDYLTKPFDIKELMARIDAVTRRRSAENDPKEVRCGEIWVNLLTRECRVGKHNVILTNNEFKLLVYLMQNANRIISRDELSEKVWGIDFDTQTNFVNVYISYIRKKIREYSQVEYIETIRGEGFKMMCNP